MGVVKLIRIMKIFVLIDNLEYILCDLLRVNGR